VKVWRENDERAPCFDLKGRHRRRSPSARYELRPRREAQTRCSYSGAPQNLLTVTADPDAYAEIIRSGEEIVVRELRKRPSRCRLLGFAGLCNGALVLGCVPVRDGTTGHVNLGLGCFEFGL
jgi:hypothetical protein